ncbi:hypothetical protein DRO61_12240 [Candidatus Bathyarchaeota archaeon]|nr:MAG: hypothetical protein DRO61_12240 [Candidatus Bathyarchaeota archaeon]
MSKNDSYWPEIRRITIDEVLYKDLIRAVSCKLKKGKQYFRLLDEYWGREYEMKLEPHNYIKKLGLPADKAPKWDILAEGQVYYVGEFKAVELVEGGPPAFFQVVERAQEILRIDDLDLYKDDMKWLYFELLRRGKENVSTD